MLLLEKREKKTTTTTHQVVVDQKGLSKRKIRVENIIEII